MNKNLPYPDTSAEHASLTLQEQIANEIQSHNNWISFNDYMQIALFTPSLGYYTGGSHKIGSAGDFVTAPSMTPLFGLTLARQLAPLLQQTAGNVYEFGAGTGELAVSLLAGLPETALQHYYIMDVSPELKQRQLELIQKQLPRHADKVVFLDSLPEEFDGVIIGNEVLDAMPCEVVRWTEQGTEQMGVSIVDDRFTWASRPVIDERILTEAMRIQPDKLPFTSELHLNQSAFIATLAQRIHRGAIIMIDYGFDEAQYYHPQRSMGTLIGHYRHHVVDDPFFWPGLMDLTCHVNFTAMAQAAVDNDLDLIGYTSQAHFLFNLGITEVLLNEHPDVNSKEYLQAAAAMQKLVAPHEMGELFKVMATGKNVDVDWQGFAVGDWCHKL